jgi:hypothetical protein
MSTRNRAAVWGTMAVVLLILVALPPRGNGRRTKAQAQRISTVNSVRSVTITLPATNTLPAAQPSAGK